MPCLSIFTTRSSYASAVLGIVILSVTRVHCDETKEHTADILVLHERIITLVFLYPQRLVGDVSFDLKFALFLKWPTPFEKRRLRPISAYNVSIVRASKKCPFIAYRKSTTRFPTNYRWSEYVTPNSPKGCLKNWICFVYE